ncbi:hypothetical protein PHYPO_G00129550 [Pangasianodon hypophthalmus]|uniref:Uncharacterized protein n=1 Tax=Pangasianodon hypophthalmus TaxID=310915 RepID=A0A5N5KSH2_PANHP|nr:hypothetical protein PHYPO_G00129550 [Pangasianodon hypophthalmus]
MKSADLCSYSHYFSSFSPQKRESGILSDSSHHFRHTPLTWTSPSCPRFEMRSERDILDMYTASPDLW